MGITWRLPKGASASAIQFPTPKRVPQPPLMSYGYEGETLFLVELEVPRDLAAGATFHAEATVDWLACADVCLPAAGDVALSLPIVGDASSQLDPTIRASMVEARARLPRPSAGWSARAESTNEGYSLTIIPPPEMRDQLPAPYFFVDSMGIIEHAKPQTVSRSGDTLRIALPRSAFSRGSVSRLRGVLVGNRDGTEAAGWDIVTPVSLSAPVAPPEGASMSLMLAALFAFAGGLLLNLMPCVFPVVSIKVLGLVHHGGGAPRAAARHGLVFGLGVVVTFWILAGLLFALRAAGESLGWGFQMQSPLVVAVLAAIMFGLALNLSGVFEVGLALTRLGGVGAGGRYKDSFVTGALAAVVSTPCTAPFMGAAMGFALVQPPFVGMLVFTMLALGLAVPYVVFSSVPSLLRHLPRPGPWLETIKQLLAFPLYATVVWLAWVFGRQVGIDGLAVLLLALTSFALGAWCWGRHQRTNGRWSGPMAAVAVITAGALAAGAVRITPTPVGVTAAAGWERYSASRLQEVRREGRPVFIDFTAAWCLSCQVNERVVLQSDAVRHAFTAANVALLRADWTSRDAEINVALSSYGRSGVPLYVVYPAGSATAARILPAVLTPGIVVNALAREAVGSP